MKAQLIRNIGTKGRLRIYWDTSTVEEMDPTEGYVSRSREHHTCPNSCGQGKPGYHNAYTELGTVPELNAWKAFGIEADYPEDRWPTKCADCGAPVPPESRPTRVGEVGIRVTRQVFRSRLYDTPSGDPEPGSIYWMDWHPKESCPYWDNCEGPHLYALLPNGEHWDLHSRASNCDRREERTHRCWVLHGEPPQLTVDKAGHTCTAGAGSIQVPNWHGFLRNGEFVQ